MKKIKTTTLLLAGILMLGGASCGRGGESAVDNTKVQIYVDNYNGGIGSKWLDSVADRFEAAYADYTLGDKKGVQVHINPHKNKGSAIIDSISTSTQDIYFSENMMYYDLVSRGLALDISDTLAAENSDGKTISSKLAQEQRDFYNYGGKYYAIPHYEVFQGIVYNVLIFEEYLLYFSDNADNGNGGFITSLTDTKSNGPDGKTGVIDGVDYTLDDGLPATYEEFFVLCQRMVDSGITPFTWSGGYGKAYVSTLLTALMANYEGVDQMRLNFTFDGTATHLVESISDSGEVVLRDEVQISSTNGYEMATTAGRYYALDFVSKIVSNQAYYDNENVINGEDSHTDAQTRYLLSNYNQEAGNKPIAMFIDGNYWENEADGVQAFDLLKNKYNVAKEDVKFAYMPLPKVDESHIGESIVMNDYYSTLAFINANIAQRDSEKIEICKEFLKFCYTDENLEDFTVTTGMTRGLNYEVSEEKQGAMTYYAKSVLNAKSQASMLYPYSTNELYINNQSDFTLGSFFETNNYQFAYTALKNGVSAKSYFEQIGSYRGQSWWQSNFSSYFNN